VPTGPAQGQHVHDVSQGRQLDEALARAAATEPGDARRPGPPQSGHAATPAVINTTPRGGERYGIRRGLGNVVNLKDRDHRKRNCTRWW